MKRLVILAAILAGIVAPAYGQSTRPLFVIERSINRNVVHYEAQLTTEGRLDSKEPVIAYWNMRANGGHREELTWAEKQLAYGFTIQPDASGRFYRMFLAADTGREIRVYQVGDAVLAEMSIGGHLAFLQKMYVSSANGGVLPVVKSIDLFGRDIQTGERRHERILPRR